MIAEPGAVYAQILNGRVHQIFTADDMPEWADVTDDPPPPSGIRALDVTLRAGSIRVGDVFDGRDFMSPPAPVETDAERARRLLAEADELDRKSTVALRAMVLAQDGAAVPLPELAQARTDLRSLDAQAKVKREQAEQLMNQ